MKSISQEMIAAYVDGELSEEDAAQVRLGEKNDAMIRGDIARYRTLRAEVESSFRPVMREPIPSRLKRLFEDAATPARCRSLPKRSSMGRFSNWITPVAIAASLMIGVFAGDVISRNETSRLHFAVDEDYSDHALHTLLLRAPSGIEEDGAKILATYRNDKGDVCREFIVGKTRRAQGLACLRANGDWSVVALTPAAPPGSYAPAGGRNTKFEISLKDYTELSGDEEQRFLEKGWED